MPDNEKHRTKAKDVGKRIKDSEKHLVDKAQEKRDAKLNKFSDIQVRFIVGFIYILVNSAAILLHPLATVILLALTAAFCASEFFRMQRSDAKMPNELVGVLSAAAYPLAMYFFSFKGIAIVCFLTVLILLLWYVFCLRARINDVSVSFFGACYCGIALSGLVLIRTALDGSLMGGVLTFGIFVSVWLNDAAAYLFGSAFGKHKFSPRISPKKTWEGVIAGIVTSGVIWSFFIFIPGYSLPIGVSFTYGVTCGLIGILGDLAESKMKRNSGVKDSGNILPGHGGLLDRTDSLFLVSIAATFLLIGAGVIPFSL